MDQINLWKFFDTGHLKGFTLIIPSVAVGNVGQLACDLLISSLNMKKIASVYSSALIPVAGYDPYDLKSSKLSSSCEAYKCGERQLVILQLRAPLVFEYAQNFLEDVVKQFKAKKIKDIIVLTSSFAHERKHIMTSPFRYLASETSPYEDCLKSLNWLVHESLEGGIKIYGGGFATQIFQICKELDVPSLIIYKYCSEGDNIPDAYEMVNYLNNLLQFYSEGSDLMSELIQPVSWKLLFGRPPPRDIY
ncbi:proteasome assembly chaperone 2 [Cydia fagiglandana]|uniref:proteasome assembly chaperone 2 n=1 Tax=Cydia fagiglandana TaxID=1458189 RepID=UPI002FEE4527